MEKVRWRARIIPIINGYWIEQKAFFDYTQAHSAGQATLFLKDRYPYPQYVVKRAEMYLD